MLNLGKVAFSLDGSLESIRGAAKLMYGKHERSSEAFDE